MRTFSEAYDAALDQRPFSNGTQGYGWMANWCDRCTHDADSDTPRPENGGVAGCPLIAVALLDKTPSEWLIQTDEASILADYHCVEFRDEDDDGPGEPTPIPDPPGQELLLPREPFEAVRMLSDESQAPAHSSGGVS